MLARQVYFHLFQKQIIKPTTLISTQRMYFACDPHTGGPEVLVAMEKKLQEEFQPVECQVVDPYGD